MTPPVEVRIHDDAVVELMPVCIARDGDDYLIGRPGSRRYLALSPAARETVRLFDGATPVRAVQRTLRQKYGDEIGALEPLLEALLGAGLIRRIGDFTLETNQQQSAGDAPDGPPRHMDWLFSRPMMALYAALVVLGTIVAAANPQYLPRPADVPLDRSGFSALLALVLGALVLAKHEWAHLVAARYLGVNASFRLARRLWFPVVVTDLTDLWLVDRSRRYLAYAAGMASDLLALAFLVCVLWLADRSRVPLSAALVETVRLTNVILLCALLWQLNIFLKSDLYYIVTTAIGVRNLDADARRYLRAPRERPAPFVVRAYAITLAAGTATWLVLAVYGVMRVAAAVRSTSTPWPAVAVGITAALAIYAAARERKRAPARYRLILNRGSAPDPGSVARGDPCAPLRSLAGAPCAPRTAVRRSQREQNSRKAPYSGPEA